MIARFLKKVNPGSLMGFTPLEARVKGAAATSGVLPLTGFTMIEMLIILSILILISSVLLANFPAFSRRAALQRSAQQLALAMREAQNMAFATRQALKPGGSASIPRHFGVYIGPEVPAGADYIIFADFFPPGSPNKQYDGDSKDGVVKKFKFESGISLSDVVFTPEGGPAESLDPDVIHIAFSVPEARATILDRTVRSGVTADIVLTGGGGAITRRVAIRNTGQIYSKQ